MSEPYMGEIRLMAFGFAPRNWALCNGQQLPINQNQALFALLGTTYGGDGRTLFALPDLRGRVPIHFGASYQLGQIGGAREVTLNASQLPAHTHQMSARADSATLVGGAIPGATKALAQAATSSANPPPPVNLYATDGPLVGMAPNSVTSVGNSQPHYNMMPSLVLNFCIALLGLFPSRN